MSAPEPTAVEVIAERIAQSTVRDEETGCRLWIAPISTNGYGKFYFGRRVYTAHRVVYELEVGPIPDGLFLDHLCRVRNCVEPSHLEPVTNHENLMRGDTPAARNAAKTHCPRGHEYDATNTQVRNGKRHCRACDRIRYQLRKAAA